MYSSARGMIILVAILLLGDTISSSAQDIVAMVKRVKPAVVSVLRFNSFGLKAGTGSGFFIEKNRIITNYHVVKNASSVKIRLNDSSEYQCKHIVAQDTAVDLAILEVELPASVKITPLSIRKNLPESGERVYVVGNPLGLEQSVSDGIVSSVRTIKHYGNTKFIQFTAAISPGNSGSPLLDGQGQVLGVARMVLTEGQNLNFAATSEQIKMLTPGAPISFVPTEKKYMGTLLSVKNAFTIDTSLICNPPSGKSIEDQNVWRIQLAGKRMNWDEETTSNNMKRLRRAITRNYEKFDFNKDTLTMAQARSVIYESMGTNNPDDTVAIEDRERVAGMQVAMAHMMAGMMLRGEAKPVATKSAMINGEQKQQLWVELKAGKEYSLFTVADTSEIEDIDVAIFRRDSVGAWIAIGSDTDDDSYPGTHFTAEQNGEYAVVWRVAKYVQNKSKGLFMSIISRVD